MKFIKYLTSATFVFVAFCSFGQTPVELADAQLEAYNNRDIDAFLIQYSDTVKVYDSSRKLLYQGKDIMRGQYAGMFESRPDLYCNLLNRIAVRNTVIEHEEVTFEKGRTILAIVMYKVSEKKIQEVHFLGRE